MFTYTHIYRFQLGTEKRGMKPEINQNLTKPLIFVPNTHGIWQHLLTISN